MENIQDLTYDAKVREKSFSHDAKSWCSVHCKGIWIHKEETFKFQRSSDAYMFKLRWS